jgi:hypothetical protein
MRTRKQGERGGNSRPSDCRCGKCPVCVENARWERIFNEKFADPQYYVRPPDRSSPLADM